MSWLQIPISINALVTLQTLHEVLALALAGRRVTTQWLTVRWEDTASLIALARYSNTTPNAATARFRYEVTNGHLENLSGGGHIPSISRQRDAAWNLFMISFSSAYLILQSRQKWLNVTLEICEQWQIWESPPQARSYIGTRGGGAVFPLDGCFPQTSHLQFFSTH